MPQPRSVLTKVSRTRQPAAAAPDRRETRRKCILDAAAEQFAECGFADCDMERVAQRAKVAKGTLYLYFPSKEDLFKACVDRGMEQLLEEVHVTTASLSDPFEKIAAAIYVYLRFFEQHPQLVELMLQERASFKDRRRPIYFEHRDVNRGPWRQLYRDLAKQGRIRNDLPVESFLDAIGSLMYGTMFTNYFVGRAVSLDEQYRSILEIAFRGILSDQERSHWEVPEPVANR